MSKPPVSGGRTRWHSLRNERAVARERSPAPYPHTLWKHRVTAREANTVHSTTRSERVSLTFDGQTGLRVFRALWRTDPTPETLFYLQEWPHALRGSGTARRRCDAVRDAVSPAGLVVAALLATLMEPATYWPDLDAVAVRTLPEVRDRDR